MSVANLHGYMPADPTNRSLTNPHYNRHKHYFSAIESYARTCGGIVLDIGCENKPYRDWFDIQDYIGIDIEPTEYVDFRADVHHLPVSDESIDHVFSTQVLEHCYNPFNVFSEIERVLKPGGTVFLTTNQWYPLHEKPHDYFRYTRYGLKSLADEVDLVPTDIIEIGSFPVRTGIRFNKLMRATLPSPLWKPIVTSTNLAIEKLSPSLGREDYTIVGIIAKKP